MAINNFNVGVGTTSQLTRYRYVATGGETSISGADADGKTLSYTVGLEQVYLNGVNLVRGQDYTATNGTSVGNLTALVASDVVEVFAYVPFNIANAVTASTVDAKGDLLVGTAADTVGRLAVGTNNYSLVADSSASTGVKWLQSQNIVQIVFASTTTQASNSTTSFADTNLSATITPTSSSNKVLVLVSQNGLRKSNGSATNGLRLKLFRGATEISLFAEDAGYENSAKELYWSGVSVSYLDEPATTSATTYKTQFANRVASALVNVQAGSTMSTIILMEVTP